MSSDYSFVVDASVLDMFASCSKRERDSLLRAFAVLAFEPFQLGDFSQLTAAGRELQVKRFGKWLISFWADHAVKELRIVDLRSVI